MIWKKNVGLSTERRDHTILIVDDSPTNLRVLSNYLTNSGFHILTAANGEQALEQSRNEPVDLILLDVIMPGINGFVTCKQLKEDEATKDIPVIFMTSLTGSSHKVKGFGAGAVDYITKPFKIDEVMARVTTHLRIRDLTHELQESNRNLNDRTVELVKTLKHLTTTHRQLVESEKMAALGRLVAGVAHEVSTPVGICVTAASTLERESNILIEACAQGKLKRSILEDYLNTVTQSNRLILANLNRTAELMESFKQVAVDRSSLRLRSFPLKKYIEDTLISLSPRIKKTPHILTVTGDETITLHAYPGAVSQIVTNLVMNSIIHAFPDHSAGNLHFHLKQDGETAIIEYSDDGCGITPDHLEKIFEPFFTTDRERGSTGLGLHIVYNLVVQKLHGTIRCESRIGSGTKFIMSLPIRIGAESDLS